MTSSSSLVCTAFLSSHDPDSDEVVLCDLKPEQHTDPHLHRAGEVWFSKTPQPWEQELAA